MQHSPYRLIYVLLPQSIRHGACGAQTLFVHGSLDFSLSRHQTFYLLKIESKYLPTGIHSNRASLTGSVCAVAMEMMVI